MDLTEKKKHQRKLYEERIAWAIENSSRRQDLESCLSVISGPAAEVWEVPEQMMKGFSPEGNPVTAGGMIMEDADRGYVIFLNQKNQLPTQIGRSGLAMT